MKVGYLLINEEPWYPLQRRQVTDLLEYIAKLDSSIEINLLVAYPWYWHLKFGLYFKPMRGVFATDRVRVRWIPLFLPLPIPYFINRFLIKLGIPVKTVIGRNMLRVIEMVLYPYILKLYYLNQIRVFHGRSYVATSVLHYAKKRSKGIKVIFDPRSDFPEENRMLGKISIQEDTFRFWKAKEAMLLKDSDVTICISDYYHSHYRNNCPYFRHSIIPNNVDTELFSYDEGNRKSVRSRLKLSSTKVFCYLGTMYPDSWHRPSVYAAFIKELRKTKNPFVMLFLIPSECHQFVSNELQNRGVLEHEYLIRHPDYEEVPDYLSGSDYGLFFMPKEKIALSVKVVEYLAVGLPVIVNENAISAAKFVKEQDTGVICNLGLGDRDKALDQVSRLDFKITEPAQRISISDLARKHFSNHKVATDYLKLYKKLGGAV